MQVEQLELKLGRRQYLSLDSAHRPNKERLDAGIDAAHCARDREAGIEMSAGATTGEEDSHSYARPIANEGSVALPPMTFSRVLPMLTRIPVISIDSTRFDRP